MPVETDSYHAKQFHVSPDPVLPVSAADLANIDLTRLTLGDTDPNNCLLDWRTILAILQANSRTPTDQPVLYDAMMGRAALALARALVSRYAQEPDALSTADGSKVTFGTRLAGWNALIVRLVAEGYAPGLAYSNVRAVRDSAPVADEFGASGPFYFVSGGIIVLTG